MILRILFLLGILLLLPIWGIDKMLMRKRWKFPYRLLLYLPNIILLLLLIIVSVNERYTLDAALLKGYLLTTTLCVAIPECIVAVLLLLGFFLKRKERAYKWYAGFSLLSGVVVFSLLLYGFTIGHSKLTVKDFEYTSHKVPVSFEGYKIVQISDFHLGTLHGNPDMVQKIVNAVNGLSPDLIVFTGDLVNYQAEELSEFKSILSEFQAADGVVSVMGNHDYMNYHKWATENDRLADIQKLQKGMGDMGWKLLLNENLVLRKGSDSIAVLGVENDGKPPFPSLGDLGKAQEGIDEDCFKILLSHDPSFWRRSVLSKTNISLTLSGHTHGMQFKLGDFSPASWFYLEWGGEYSENQQTLYVSLGVGEVLLPFRLGAWPEINLITLSTE